MHVIKKFFLLFKNDKDKIEKNVLKTFYANRQVRIILY